MHIDLDGVATCMVLESMWQLVANVDSRKLENLFLSPNFTFLRISAPFWCKSAVTATILVTALVDGEGSNALMGAATGSHLILLQRAAKINSYWASQADH
ncbi:hypothetical protein N7G274_001138 [Stereocaulon virgatum]|uniref:Uncharacterized protein n=1 Tax=Stereocaulon virgatum TaxID=373712 RepID=A0ABR4AR44_9LECA